MLAPAVLITLLLAACGGSSVAAPPAAAPQAPTWSDTDDTDPLPGVTVRGLTGTLNHDDVHQAMDARQPQFDACIDEVRGRDNWVNGRIKFDFKVDAQGKVEEAFPVESDVGHRELERCLGRVVQQTVFPKPAGRAQARFSWDLSVAGVYAHRTDQLEPRSVRTHLRKRSRDIFVGCKVRRWKNEFQVTAYVGRRGRVLSAGAISDKPVEDDKLGCVLDAVKGWKLPKQKRRSKVSFLLK